MAFLEAHGIPLVQFPCVCMKCDLHNLSTLIRPGDVLFMHGGGNFGDAFSSCNNLLRQRLVRSFPRTESIILPQTMVPWRTRKSSLESVEVFKRHGSITLVARDLVSKTAMRALYPPNVSVQLSPDMAFWIPPPTELSKQSYDIVWLGRSDKEKRGSNPVNESDVYVVDWFGPDAKHPDPAGSYLEKAKYAVTRAFNILSKGKVVVTDRLHGHILALILGRPHVILDNSYGKLRHFYATWSKVSPYTFPAGNPVEALALARLLVRNYDDSSKLLRIVPELVKSKNRWLSLPGAENSFGTDSVDKRLEKLSSKCIRSLAQTTSLPPLTPLMLPNILSNNPLSQALRDYAARVARSSGSRNEVILSFVTSGYADFAINWALSLEKVSCRAYLLLCLDRMAYEKLLSYNVNAFFFPPHAIMEVVNVHNRSLEFASKDFLHLMRFRAWTLALLVHHHNILFSDLDIVFTRNPLEYISQLPGHDLYLSVDNFDEVPTSVVVYNGGFFYAKHTKPCHILFTCIYDLLLDQEETNDQVALNTCTKKMVSDKRISIAVLEETLFPNGYKYFEKKIWARGGTPVIVHVNWLYSAENKRHRMREHHLWFLDDAWRDEPSSRFLTVILGPQHDYIEARRRIVEAVVLARLTRRILILPLIARKASIAETAIQDIELRWPFLANELEFDTFERFFSVKLLEEQLGSEQFRENSFLQPRFQIGLETRYLLPNLSLSEGISPLCSSGEASSAGSLDLAMNHAELDNKLLVLCGSFHAALKNHYSSELQRAEQALWYTTGIKLRVDGIISKASKRRSIKELICLRLEHRPTEGLVMNALHILFQKNNCTAVYPLKNSRDYIYGIEACQSLIVLSLPVLWRKELSQVFLELLLTTPYVSFDDELNVPLEIQYCVDAHEFFSSSCASSFSELVLSKRTGCTELKL